MPNHQKIIHNERNVATVYSEIKVGWEQWVLLVSDQHHDSANCNRELEKEQLDQALKRDALIISCGDTFDMMQGKFDPRKSFAGLRPEYLHQMVEQGNEAYLDIIVKDAIEFYKPYARNFLVIGRGNHDTSIEKKSGSSPIGNLVYGLNQELKGDHRIQAGGYGGWVKFNFGTKTGNRSSLRLKYFHGNGGDAPVTRGMIQTARQAVYLPDADVVVNGHNHQTYVTSIARERLSDSGKVLQDVVTYVRTPGYNQGYGDGFGGWEAENHPPKPVGCVWMRLWADPHYHIKREFTSSIHGG